jgi:hypothetical protein
VGSAGGEGTKRRGLDRRAQFHCAAEFGEHEERRQGFLLSLQRGQRDRRHRRSDPRGLSGPDRQDRQIRLRRYQGRQTPEDAGDHGRDQGGHAIKADKRLADMALVKYSRLSVQPVTPEQWKIVCKMGGL